MDSKHKAVSRVALEMIENVCGAGRHMRSVMSASLSEGRRHSTLSVER